MQNWKKNYTTVRYPLQSKREKAQLGNSFLQKGASYYASAATLPNEYASEFGIDNAGKCFYTAYMGPYTSNNIDSAGNKFKNLFLSCITWSDWQITESPDFYLQISYKPVDISVSIMKYPVKDKGTYKLAITMFRFTSLQ